MKIDLSHRKNYWSIQEIEFLDSNSSFFKFNELRIRKIFVLTVLVCIIDKFKYKNTLYMPIEFDFVESIIRSNRIMYVNIRAMIFFFFFLTRDYITRFFIFKFNLKKKKKSI